MSDLIKRLRDGLTLYSLNNEAADEIERLKAGLESEEPQEYCHNEVTGLHNMADLREIERLQERFDYAVKKNGEQWAEIERLRERESMCRERVLEQEIERLRELTENDGKEIGSYREGTGLRGENQRLRETLDRIAKELRLRRLRRKY